MSKKITTIEELRQDLLENYDKLRLGEIGLREAKERANTAGKILNSAKLELEYNVYIKSKTRIPFLENIKNE